MTQTTAVVMNMFYTGLGIARSLGRRGVPVIGLSSQRGIYGTFTRYATIRYAPDSREEPGALLEYLLRLGKELGGKSVLFPTRDDDVTFLDRYREQLEPLYSVVVAHRDAVRTCLDKWETSLWAQRAGVPTPKTWSIDNTADLERIAAEVTYPCVLKPLVSHYWRQGGNWQIVGARKVIGISSARELIAEYTVIGLADARVVVQEMIPGNDDCLVIAACYMDRSGRWVDGFNTQKLAQEPAHFGTGCIVQNVDRPELFEPTRRLLEEIGYTGIAEVEYKWDARDQTFKLIEVNPRPWDQHTLGQACGVDLIEIAYCDHAGLPKPRAKRLAAGDKWIAEDAFLTTLLRTLWRRDPAARALLRLARGKRLYAIWSARDPLPLMVYALARYLPDLAAACFRRLWRGPKNSTEGTIAVAKGRSGV